MTAVRLDGTATAAAIKAELRSRVDVLRSRGIVPGLGTLLVGDDPTLLDLPVVARVADDRGDRPAPLA